MPGEKLKKGLLPSREEAWKEGAEGLLSGLFQPVKEAGDWVSGNVTAPTERWMDETPEGNLLAVLLAIPKGKIPMGARMEKNIKAMKNPFKTVFNTGRLPEGHGLVQLLKEKFEKMQQRRPRATYGVEEIDVMQNKHLKSPEGQVLGRYVPTDHESGARTGKVLINEEIPLLEAGKVLREELLHGAQHQLKGKKGFKFEEEFVVPKVAHPDFTEIDIKKAKVPYEERLHERMAKVGQQREALEEALEYLGKPQHEIDRLSKLAQKVKGKEALEAYDRWKAQQQWELAHAALTGQPVLKQKKRTK